MGLICFCAGNNNLFKLFDVVSDNQERIYEIVKEINDFVKKERLQPTFAVNL